MRVNVYRVFLDTGETIEICASNVEGATAQVSNISKYVNRIERIYKSGKRAVCPW